LTRDDCIWVAIRVVGLMFVYRLVVSLAGLLSLGVLGAGALAAGSQIGTESEVGAAVISQLYRSRAAATPIELVLYAAGAWYFLRGAPAVTRFIARSAGRSAAA